MLDLHSRLFDLHPEKWIVIWRVLCKIYPDFYNVQPEIFFQGGSLKKAGCHTSKSEKNQVSTLKKIWLDATLKKISGGMPPYKNLGTFFRVPFKSLLKVQIKPGNWFNWEGIGISGRELFVESRRINKFTSLHETRSQRKIQFSMLEKHGETKIKYSCSLIWYFYIYYNSKHNHWHM